MILTALLAINIVVDIIEHPIPSLGCAFICLILKTLNKYMPAYTQACA